VLLPTSLELIDWDVPVANDLGMCGFIVMRWPLGVKAEQVHNRAILIRHTARAALALERLQEEANGDFI
jgi:hypothetical protein